MTGGIDGGEGQDWEAKQHNVAVVVGKRTLACKRDAEEEPASRQRCGFGQPIDTTATRRLSEGRKKGCRGTSRARCSPTGALRSATSNSPCAQKLRTFGTGVPSR